MRIHRTKRAHGFTVLPTELLRDRKISYTARGLLTDLLSRPDGWREDGQQMADTSTQGRGAVARALRELTKNGYYRVERLRMPDGKIITQTHVYDVPFAWKAGTPDEPAAEFSGSGQTTVEGPTGHPSKNREVEQPPPLPAPRKPPKERRAKRGAGGWRKHLPVRPDEPAAPAEPEAPAEPPDEATAQAAALLHGVTSREPRLRLGAVEALALAPLVKPWLAQGLGPSDLAEALLSRLPEPIYSAPALLRDRLVRKLPPPPPPAPPPSDPAPGQPPSAGPPDAAATPPPTPRRHECAECARPTLDEGICRACAGLAAPPPEVVDSQVETNARGMALVRSAFRQRSPLPAPGT